MDNLKYINSLTRNAYDRAAQKYHDLFHNEMYEKKYDQNLLDSFAARFTKGSLICDAGCGPSAHIGRYLFDLGFNVVGLDISEKCIELAKLHNPEMKFECADINNMPFNDNTLDGIISYYSIINTPKIYINKLFGEFKRVLKRNGYLLVSVKTGTTEGFIEGLLEIHSKHYFTLFTIEEIENYFNDSGFIIEFIDQRNPYDFEISNERIFAIGKKV